MKRVAEHVHARRYYPAGHGASGGRSSGNARRAKSSGRSSDATDAADSSDDEADAARTAPNAFAASAIGVGTDAAFLVQDSVSFEAAHCEAGTMTRGNAVVYNDDGGAMQFVDEHEFDVPLVADQVADAPAFPAEELERVENLFPDVVDIDVDMHLPAGDVSQPVDLHDGVAGDAPAATGAAERRGDAAINAVPPHVQVPIARGDQPDELIAGFRVYAGLGDNFRPCALHNRERIASTEEACRRRALTLYCLHWSFRSKRVHPFNLHHLTALGVTACITRVRVCLLHLSAARQTRVLPVGLVDRHGTRRVHKRCNSRPVRQVVQDRKAPVVPPRGHVPL